MKIWMLIQETFSGRAHLQGWLVAGVMFFVICCGQLLASDDGTKQGVESNSKKSIGDGEGALKGASKSQGLVFARDSDAVLEAFGPIVTAAPDSVVEVLVNDKRVALGTFVSSEGEILTKASQITGNPNVRLSTGDVLPPQIVGIDLKEDLALLKIQSEKNEAILWENPSKPEVGAWVVSSLPGKSVGAIGIVSVGPREIPKERGALGVRLDNEAEGVVVSDFSGKDTPAKRAGVRVGDRITEVNNEPLEEILDLIKAIQSCSPGDVVVLSIEREGASLTLEVVLDTLAVIDDAWKHKEMQENLGAELSLVRSGFTMAMQHDAELRPVDCGGPLLDLAGKPIGLNIARAGRVCSYTLPIDVVKERLEVLRSGELAPENVFATRIERLDAAMKKMTQQVEADFSPQLQELNDSLADLLDQKDEVDEEVEAASSRLNELSEKIDQLQSQRDELDKKIADLKGKQEQYQTTVEALRKGIRVN